jgi:hypothetical protein
MGDPRIPTGPLEQEPTPLFLPVQDRAGLAHQVLAEVRLGAWDRRILHWLASGTDTSTLLTILSLIERAKAAELAAERSGAHDREPAAVDRGGLRLPAIETPGRDVNPACGHRLGAYCEGCGTCTACDGCYCEEP